MIVHCDECGKEIKRFPCQISQHNFCCDECKHKFKNKNKLETECVICGKKEKVSKSRAENYKTCSMECSSIYKKSLVENNAICPVCKKSFHVKPYHLVKVESPCCSKECDREMKKIKMTGEGNHQYGLKGELNSTFKSEFQMNRYGYLRGYNYCHPLKSKCNYILIHRAIMEEYLRVKNKQSEFLKVIDGVLRLKKNIEVHHINHNKLDNRKFKMFDKIRAYETTQ